MNRIGLAITLVVAVIVGLLFAVYPRLDIAIAALFFKAEPPRFDINAQAWVQICRDAARVLVGLLVAPAAVALLGKLVMPGRRMLIPGRAAMFLALTLVLGPGLIANGLLKDHWGRTRPIDLTEFGGTGRFTPWWDPRGDCPDNCSFIAGEPSGAFWTLAPAALAPPQWRVLTYGGALAFGAAIGALRVAAGGHFFTDVVFAFVIMFLVVWTVHGLLYRWGAADRIKIADEGPPG
jgi:lipid A 4'-phosphatase